MKQAKAHLAKLDGTTSKGMGSFKKSTKKPKEFAAVASQADPALQAQYMFDIKQAQEAAEKAKAKGEQAAWTCSNSTQICCQSTSSMHGTRSSITSDPYMDLLGSSKKGTRGLLPKSFDDCMMLHLLTMFPNNAAEQERCYIKC